jgi:hypothetical protein
LPLLRWTGLLVFQNPVDQPDKPIPASAGPAESGECVVVLATEVRDMWLALSAQHNWSLR